ncbi:hypothetical protein LTR91_019270 [Friedmanniomyces endolithicus]|uniref:SWIM-type domain-containing protein n=1 Tax=Friedmanniomyces endolithicus TaxID=329885 RepID=A0AAN6H9Y6_9PEZI|nr:hypothetical protein LTR94_015474 [Friedmanniomyces endolithicus]KAK0771646.1 hypothetical protein LTR59_015995 [Friedmanniomyces endolithicus]KAK0777656.1 hypothetical protein LTR75_015880 [Friedmanniomyces endolithicus]KAK0778091.1 hypothetical protein LTR38_014915 [Friedmanniomyces endolithicus]KAK0833521.1 hypothetical protein LTR03_014704 [Friedmanniomyces endolithicus]
MGVQDVPTAQPYSAYGNSSSASTYYPQFHTQQVPHLARGPYATGPSTHAAGTTGPTKKRKAPVPDGTPVVDLTQDSPPRKRKAKQQAESVGFDAYNQEKPKKRAKKSPNLDDNAKSKTPTKQPEDEEKRLRRWRKHAPTSYLEIRSRALTQRMFCLDRQRDTSNPSHPTETISLAGTTGNVYTIVIDKVPSCDCPHARKGNQCKHIAYVLSRVLRAPAQLEYQLALTSAELREIFAKAPPLPSETAEKGEEKDGRRKAVEGECPICCVDFEPESGEAVVYCKAACGNNIHADCFKQWAATKGRGLVPCPFCRTPWQVENAGEGAAKDVAREGPRNGEGYVNVAAQLGLSGRRDYSSYHPFWVRRQAMNGEIGEDEDGVLMHRYMG